MSEVDYLANRRGYFGIGIVGGKFSTNVGTLLRSAHAFGACIIFTVGARYTRQCTDTPNVTKHLLTLHWGSVEEFVSKIPENTTIVGVENGAGGTLLPHFKHPERTIYVLGAEDRGLPVCMIEACNYVVEIPTKCCLNVAVAGSIVMYDRIMKGGGEGI